MKKIIILLAILSLFCCSSTTQREREGIPNLHPKAVLRDINGKGYIGYLYEINGKTVLLNTNGGLLILE